MIAAARDASRLIGLSLVLILVAGRSPAAHDPAAGVWVGTWATAPRPEEGSKEPAIVPETTLRQIIRVSLGGRQVRLRLSNAFGTTALSFHGVHLALAGPAGTLQPGSERLLRFNGLSAVSVPPGASLFSDPLDFDLPPLADVAVSLYLHEVPATLTMHHGSRTTSYLQAGEALAASALPDALRFVRWFFVTGLDVRTTGPAAAVVVLGDSITDGYGCTTDWNNRWTDAFARRLHERPGDGLVGVLNQGIGGNRLLRDGLGPNMLARLDRDVLTQTGARWVIVQAGINDIGTRIEARKRGEAHATASEIIAAYRQIISRARTQGLLVVGTTLTPYAGADFYWSEDGEKDRLAINAWIRTSGQFDAVIDFDEALRDPQQPSRLASAFDSGDHLHPSLAGYGEMARFVDLELFKLKAAAPQTRAR